MTAADLAAIQWPDPITPEDRWDPRLRMSVRHYQTPLGRLPGCTTVIKNALGLGKEAQIRWSCKVERETVLAAVVSTHERYPGLHGKVLAGEVEKRLGKERASIKKMRAAGDVGTAIHGLIQHHLRWQMGLSIQPTPEFHNDQAWLGYTAWREWWEPLQRTPIRIEQTIWSDLGYAGTFDCLSSDPDGTVVMDDWKSSTGIYDDHHVQLASYMHAARTWCPQIDRGEIVRLPKSLDDAFFRTGKIEPVPLGHLYGGRARTEAQLLDSMKAAIHVWRCHFAHLEE